MKLVESEVPDHPTGEAPPPRPPRRRVAVSLLFTLSVLIGTVVVVFTVFPKRHNEILAIAVDHHREPEPAELSEPSLQELQAWTVRLFDEPAPWPAMEGASIDAAYALRIFKQPVALIRVRVKSESVTLMALQARDAPPRKRRLIDDALVAMSWRSGRWTFVAVGRAASAEAWRPVVGAR